MATRRRILNGPSELDLIFGVRRRYGTTFHFAGKAMISYYVAKATFTNGSNEVEIEVETTDLDERFRGKYDAKTRTGWLEPMRQKKD
jgi:hypothetical protein